jgi:hypothetical protein
MLACWLQKAVRCLILAGLLLPRLGLAGGPPPIIVVQPVSQNALLLGLVSFSVTASSGTTMSYQWYKDGSAISGATSSTYTILSVLGTSVGNYYVKVSNAGGWVLSDTATLNVVDAPPGIITQPESQTVVQGQNATLAVVASGAGPLSYQWFFNGTSLGATGTSATLTLLGVGANQAGAYQAVMANSLGSITSAVATLTVLVPPGIATQPQSQSVARGQNASFSVVASGTVPLSYQWYFNGSSLGFNNQTLTVDGAEPNKAGNYTVVVTNVAGSATSAVATLTVLLPPEITTQPQSQSVVRGQNASFSVVTSGSAPISYQWNFNGSALPGATTSALTLTNVGTTQAGGYTVLVTNSAGSVTSVVASLTVVLPTVTLSLNPTLALGSTGFTIQLSVPVGLTYVIQASSDFQTWTPIATNVATTGSATFTDAEATNNPTRFYRAVVP